MTISHRKVSVRPFAAIAMLCFAAAFAGCAASSSSPGAAAPVAATSAADASQALAARPMLDFSGVWDGQSVASCMQFNPFAINTRCNAINKIAITMVQENTKITGFYKCTIGNMDCRDQNDSGTISSGSIQNGRVALRIGMPDGSSCIFNGAPSGANQLKGSYTCYQGGGLVEQGRFEIARGY
jgi:hypothetical protein